MKIPIEQVAAKYRDPLYAAAFAVTKQAQDAEDVVQETFLAYYTTRKQFDSEEHIRAWLLRVAINKSKNILRTFWRRNRRRLTDEMEELTFDSPESENLFEAVMKLPDNYRAVVHLHYYEDYSVREIAQILSLSESNVKTRLSRARKQLRDTLKEAWDDDE